MNILGNLSHSEFLAQYWQKKPLLIKQSFPGYQSPISPEELAGLACEEDIESRLIMENGQGGSWQLRHGPFTEGDFTSLPATHWSLLVQAVNHHTPELSELLRKFDFIPNWRIDDVMISYAPIHGSVGPHLDNYDVFLLQVQGQRHWHLNESDYTEDDFIEGLELKILRNFQSEKDWILEPGDMLYLPPGVAHHGIALNNCLTYSIGFRAPSIKELLSAFTVNFNNTEKDTFYSDPDLQLQESSGEIKEEHIQALRELMLSTLSNKTDFSSWFGCFITDNFNPYESEQKILDESDFYHKLKQTGQIQRHGDVRVSYIKDNGTLKFFYAGNELKLSMEQLELIRYLCSRHHIDYYEIIKLSDETKILELLYKLYQEGCFHFDE